MVSNSLLNLNLLTVGNSQTLLDQCRFRYLETWAIEDPFSFIREFCAHEMEMEYLKRDVLDLLKTAYSYREEFFAGTHKSYVYNQIQLVKVVEVMYVLHVGDWDLKPGLIRQYVNRYSCLDNSEQKDIRIFLSGFFTFHNLNEWLSVLDDLLIHAYKEGDPDYFVYEKEPFKTMTYLEKLTEAVFLVYEIMDLKATYPKASGDVSDS